MTFGIEIAKKVGFKRTSFACMLTFSVSIYISTYSPNFLIFLILYGVIPGFALGIAF